MLLQTVEKPDIMCHMKGRPKLPEGQRRDVTIRARIKPEAAKKLEIVRRQQGGISEGEAIRRALAYWISHDCGR